MAPDPVLEDLIPHVPAACPGPSGIPTHPLRIDCNGMSETTWHWSPTSHRSAERSVVRGTGRATRLSKARESSRLASIQIRLDGTPTLLGAQGPDIPVRNRCGQIGTQTVASRFTVAPRA